MNRNTEQHFGTIPKIHAQRSKFDESHSIKTTMNVGDIIPIEVTEILPGDTMKLDLAEIVRMATPLYPIMDNLYMDIYNFFVPSRLTFDHWPEFWGENEDPWIQQTEYQVPQIEAPEGGWAEGTIADYMGIPTYVNGISVNALPFRAYAKIYNDWFRDENLLYNCHIYTDETTRTGSNGTTTVTDVELGGKPAKAAKLHDYFTSALPSMQKGPAVSIPLGTSAQVKTGANSSYKQNEATYPLKWGTYSSAGKYAGDYVENNPSAVLYSSTTGAENTIMEPYQHTTVGYDRVVPNNLYADLNDATAATISELRTAFAIQKYYEQIGRSGWAKAF